MTSGLTYDGDLPRFVHPERRPPKLTIEQHAVTVDVPVTHMPSSDLLGTLWAEANAAVEESLRATIEGRPRPAFPEPDEDVDDWCDECGAPIKWGVDYDDSEVIALRADVERLSALLAEREAS